jgi:hypothetical protein
MFGHEPDIECIETVHEAQARVMVVVEIPAIGVLASRVGVLFWGQK